MFQHLQTVESCTDMIPRDSNNVQRFCLSLTFLQTAHTFPFVHAICTTYRRRSHYMFLTRLSYLEVQVCVSTFELGSVSIRVCCNKIRCVLRTLSGIFRDVFGNQNGHFNPNLDLFQTLTKYCLFPNLSRA